MNEEGIEVLLQTLFQFQESTRFHQLHHVLCVATATIRQSENQEEIKSLLKDKRTLLLEYYQSMRSALRILGGYEFYIVFRRNNGRYWWEVRKLHTLEIEILEYHSFPFGALSLKQQFIKGDIPTKDELEECNSI